MKCFTLCKKQQPGNIDEKDDGRCEEHNGHAEGEECLFRFHNLDFLLLFLATLNVQLTMVPASPPIAKNAMLQRETKVPPIAWPASGGSCF